MSPLPISEFFKVTCASSHGYENGRYLINERVARDLVTMLNEENSLSGGCGKEYYHTASLSKVTIQIGEELREETLIFGKRLRVRTMSAFNPYLSLDD